MESVVKRQGFDNGDGYYLDNTTSFWWTREGQIVRWSIFFAIFFLFMAYILGGYLHAKQRIKKGLPPLRYHRWLLNRSQRARFDPNYQNPSAYYNPYPNQNEGQYGMHPMPPPMYDPSAPPPPRYQPPAGATKVDPSQWGAGPTRTPTAGEPSPAYDAPPGPPPAAVQANHTGASSASNNPYRL